MKYRILKDSVLQNWYLVGDFLSDDEINLINNIVRDTDYTTGNIIGGNPDGYRNSQIKWIPFDNEWLYDRIWDWANVANNDLWNFDIEGFKDQTQYTSYDAPAGHYDWHLDILGDDINHRKISLVCPLNDGYEGGKLQFKFGKDYQEINLLKGQAVFFPSFYLHRVTPVTKGNRKSLVQWVSGDPYR
tara:strand:+ start:1494 stop:2054 length:561 start_codon:yes stop_codon:yes gene_type:complete